DYSILRALDRVSGTDLRARRLIAVHADDGHRLCRLRPIDVVELDHRLAAVRVTLRTRLHTRVAADATVRIDEELQPFGYRHATSSFPVLRPSTTAAVPARRRSRAVRVRARHAPRTP